MAPAAMPAKTGSGASPQPNIVERAIGRIAVCVPGSAVVAIHGELLKLGFQVAQLTVAKYMIWRLGPTSQGWRTFLRNHAPDIAAMDLFVVPTIGFRLLYGIV